MAREIAIDLGTATTLVNERSKGILFSVPSVVALNQETGDVFAIGDEAEEMIGRTTGDIVTVRPLQSGAIRDFDVAEILLRSVLKRAGISGSGRSKVLVAVPRTLTDVERRAVQEATLRAGARSCYLVEQVYAAAVGAGLAIDQPTGHLVVNIGGGTTEVGLLSLGAMVTCTAVKVGGFDLDEAINAYIRREHQLAVGAHLTEQIKIEVGSAFPQTQERKTELRGRDLVTGEARQLTITSEEVRGAITDQTDSIVEVTVDCIGKSPPDLAQDLMLNGITLTGGGAKLSGIDGLLAAGTNVPVRVSDRPQESVVLGAGKCFEMLNGKKSALLNA
jgi:rod shape-determining protein MreB